MTDINTTELAAVEAAATPAPISIKDAVLAQFKEAETAQRALADKYRDCVYPVATTKGMQEAIAARADLRDNGRLSLTKTETRVKKEVNDLKRLMGEEVERLVAITKPVEDSIDAQIKAEEDRKAAAKAERERIERERVEKHEAGIAKLRGYGERCRGKSIDDLEQALSVLRPLTFSEEEWQEFAPKAADALAASISQIEAELSVAQQRKRDEEHRLANERLAAQLAAQKAELDRQAAELMRQRVTATVFNFPEPETETEPDPEIAPPEAVMNVAALASPKPQPIYAPVSSLVAANNAARAEIKAQATQEAATVKLGEICALVGPGFSMTAAFVADTLGIEHSATDKAAKLYKPSDVPLICDELIQRLLQIKSGELKAA